MRRLFSVLVLLALVVVAACARAPSRVVGGGAYVGGTVPQLGDAVEQWLACPDQRARS